MEETQVSSICAVKMGQMFYKKRSGKEGLIQGNRHKSSHQRKDRNLHKMIIPHLNIPTYVT